VALLGIVPQEYALNGSSSSTTSRIGLNGSRVSFIYFVHDGMQHGTSAKCKK